MFSPRPEKPHVLTRDMLAAATKTQYGSSASVLLNEMIAENGRDIALQKRYALELAMLSSFITPFMISAVNVALPTIAEEFGMTVVALSWVATAYLLSAAAFLVPFGRIADIRGRKRIFLAGMWVFLIATALCCLAPSSTTLIAFRYIQGIGGAMVFGTSIAILTSVYPASERGKALGLSVSLTYVGLSLGPSLGGLMTGSLGWRSIFAATIPLMLALIWLASVRLKGEWCSGCGERFDPQGAIMYVLSLTSVIVGLSLLPRLAGIASTVAGGLLLMAFVLWELKHPSPVLDMALFARNRPFALSNLAALINYSATFAVAFMLSLYLQYVRGYTPEATGFVLVSQTVVMAAFSPLAGRLSDLIEPRVIASIGMLITAIGLAMIALFGTSSSVWTIVMVLGFLGFGFALFSSPNTNAIMSAVDRRQYGVASASVGTMRMVGQVLSLGIATVFLAVYVGSVKMTPELAPEFMEAFQPAFLTFSALCFLGVLASMARGRVR